MITVERISSDRLTVQRWGFRTPYMIDWKRLECLEYTKYVFPTPEHFSPTCHIKAQWKLAGDCVNRMYYDAIPFPPDVLAEAWRQYVDSIVVEVKP